MAQKVNKTPAINPKDNFIYSEFVDHALRLNAALVPDGTEPATGPMPLRSYPKASLPVASLYTGYMIFVTDDVGGSIPAFSDGTNWRRVTDRAVIA